MSDAGVAAPALPAIPVLDVGPDWVLEALEREMARVHALLDTGAGRIPATAVRIADRVSQRWLERHRAPHLAEIDAIAARVGRPGAHFLNVSYEWGCSCRVGPSPDGSSTRLLRVLDWPDPGLGRHIMAVRVAGGVGRWLSLTWPGYTGVLQGIAPGRFAAAMNQAPMDSGTGVYALDWLAARAQIWRRPHVPAAYLLRRVFETAADFHEARRMLTETPVAASAIYSLAGLHPSETCVIQRRPDEAHVTDGDGVAVNAWDGTAWSGRERGEENPGRAAAMRSASTELSDDLGWLRPPVLNDRTRLVFVADAASGAFLARGYEADGPATEMLRAVA